jgi:predicted O-methyltransferase YrrM
MANTPGVSPTLSSALAVLDQLSTERPAFHGHGAEPVNWQLGDGLLRWLVQQLPTGSVTLETGCGYSTVAFTAHCSAHTVISPVAVEHERIRAWSEAQGLDSGRVRFVLEPSQVWLPAAATELGELDAVLIDGDHAYPVPSLDWYYTAPALKVGGLMVVDDIQIRACGQLADFLSAETGRWEAVTTIDDAAVFRKVSPSGVGDMLWNQQPWNEVHRPGQGPLASLRAAVRLRSRLRDLAGRAP